MVEGQLRDSIRSKKFYDNENFRVRSRYRPTPAKIHPSQMGGGTRRESRAGFWSGIYPRLSVAAAGEKHRVEGRPAGDRIPEVTGIHRNSQKRALCTTDGTDSMTSGSDTPEGYADRPPDVKYSERRMTEKRQDEGGTEILGSPHMTLERAVIQLQKDLDDCRTKFENHEKAYSGGQPLTAETGGIYVDTSPEILGEVELGTVP